MQVKKQQLEPDMEQWTGSKSGKEYIVTLLINLYAEYIMRNTGLDEAQLELRLPGEVSIISDMQMISPLSLKAKRN